MTQEDRYLLIKDLSARLPYGVLVHYCNKSHTLYTNDFVLDERLLIEFRCSDRCVELKPYLRSMSDMTEEEAKELYLLLFKVEKIGIPDIYIKNKMLYLYFMIGLIKIILIIVD